MSDSWGAGIFMVEYIHKTNSIRCGHCKAPLVEAETRYAYKRAPHCTCGAVPRPCEATTAPEVIEDE